MALTDKLTAIGDAIRDKTGSTDLLTLDAMPTAISGITTGGGADLPEEAFTITGDCSYMFNNGKWDWFIKEHGHKVITSELTDLTKMFSNSSVQEIPFAINGTLKNYNSMSYLFAGCENLKTLPYITAYPNVINHLFNGCYNLTEIPEDWGDNINWDRIKTYTSANCGSVFASCRSLREVPHSLLNNLKGMQKNTSVFYNSCFYDCCSMDEIKDIPVVESNLTSNTLSSMFSSCSRMKSVTFQLNDSVPYIVSWKSQTLDLSLVGFVVSGNDVTSYSSGITKDKLVKDDATYQALKDDPDWFTTKIEYSRYNHDSAVETINSLPDTSAYLATAGGTNTIKFIGDAGSLTDGGAINTLTEEEIAVATAKGWTVTLS